MLRKQRDELTFWKLHSLPQAEGSRGENLISFRFLFQRMPTSFLKEHNILPPS